MAGKFNKNYAYKFEIGESEETLMTIAGGITNHDTSFDEDSEDMYYYDGNGGAETVYNGLKVAYSFTGNRKFGDEGQEFIRDKVFNLSNRNCYFKVTEPDGRIIAGPATLGEIKISGGDTTARPDFECTIAFVGIPKDTKAPQA